jgi:diaminobutyrate-2-oxoglutarate transaminase
MDIFQDWESNVRSYCRSFPIVFQNAEGPYLYSESGKRYLDFFAGAGALNYGHNHKYIKDRVLSYFQSDNVLHALDMHTSAKRHFMENFVNHILVQRNLHYKIQFCGPTGTNAVEAALKLARRVKKRSGIFSFDGGFHGMSLGALAVSSNMESRNAAGVPLTHVSFMPYFDQKKKSSAGLEFMDQILTDSHSGVEKPAAIIFETVQAEGGVNVASTEWMQRLRELCNKHDVLLICDDIQVGCFRTGPFFSFERANVVPDLVTLSKSISGLGFPMSLVLMKPELDIWMPGEHTGTFRGNQLAFVGADAAIDLANKIGIESIVKANETFLDGFLHEQIGSLSEKMDVRGVGMIWGIDVSEVGGPRLAKRVTDMCFEKGLIVERAGRQDTVIKLLPPLTIDANVLEEGCQIIRESVAKCI